MVVHLIPEVGFGWTLCFLDFGFASLREPDCSPSDYPYQDAVRGNGSHPTVTRTYLRSLDRCRLFSTVGDPVPQYSLTANLARGMFIPLTFLGFGARSHGMSERLANYLVPTLNGARSVLFLFNSSGDSD